MISFLAIGILTIIFLHTASAWTRFTVGGKSVDYTRWFSDEGNGYSGRQTAPIAGLVCHGHYCDDLRLITVRDGSAHPVLNSWHWTRWFSEENPSSADCPQDMVVNELQCSGHYCDNIRMQCGRLAAGYRVVVSDIRQVDWFSEEEGERRCADGYYLWGMACSGHYCDSLKLKCARVDYITHPRPVYIINHRANSVGDIDDAVAAGANAIECDVRYGGGRWVVDHDGVFFWSTRLSSWLSEASRVANERGEGFALIIFDIKTPVRLDELRKIVRDGLPSNLNRIFSTGEYKDRNALNVIDQSLTAHEGVAIDFDNDPAKVQGHFVGRGVSNFWYGNGICVPCIGPNVHDSLVDATKHRDAGEGIKKTYVWTLAKSSSITDYFKNVKVDGVMVNIGTVREARRIAVNEGLRIAPRSEPAFAKF